MSVFSIEYFAMPKDASWACWAFFLPSLPSALSILNSTNRCSFIRVFRWKKKATDATFNDD